MAFLSKRYLIESYWSSLLGGDWRTCLRKQSIKRSWLCTLCQKWGKWKFTLQSYSKPSYPCLWSAEVGKKAMESWQLSAPSRKWHVISTHNPLAKISHLSPSNCKERISSHKQRERKARWRGASVASVMGRRRGPRSGNAGNPVLSGLVWVPLLGWMKTTHTADSVIVC